MFRKIVCDEQKICKEYQAGASTLVLAKKNGISYTTVNKILRKNNTPLRSHKEKTKNAYKTGKMTHMKEVWKANSENWKGEGNPRLKPLGSIRTSYNTDYILIKTKEGWKLRARVVAEESLGRKLKEEEIIHHINGIKNDDRIENLYRFNNGKEHRRYHMADNLLKGIIEKEELISNLL